MTHIGAKNLVKMTAEKDAGYGGWSFELKFGLFDSGFIQLPTFLIGVHYRKDYKYSGTKFPWWHIGRLYRGYVGMILLTRHFEIIVWIHNVEKVKESK